jgi:chromosome segregation ATPase
MDARATSELHELRERDRKLAEEASRLHAVEQAVTTIRRRAEAIAAELGAFPAELELLRLAAKEADKDLDQRRSNAEAAARELEHLGDDESRQRAERDAARARERADAAVRKFERSVAAVERLEGDTAELPGELAELDRQARRLADATPELGTPEPGADGLIAWASQAHAMLFVEIGQLDRQRDNAIREANELATMLLGEPTYGSTVAQAVDRVEQSRR